MVDHPLDALDDLLIGASASLVQHAYPHQADPRSDPVPFAILPTLAVGNDPGYMSAMTVRIYRIAFPFNIIDPGQEAALCTSVHVAHQARMFANPGIHHRDCHP